MAPLQTEPTRERRLRSKSNAPPGQIAPWRCDLSGANKAKIFTDNASTSSDSASSYEPSIVSSRSPSPSLFDTPSSERKSIEDNKHIPRPRNAFILYRSWVYTKITGHEKDHQNISRVAGIRWRGLAADEKAKWEAAAVEEKRRHALLHPDYKYLPRKRTDKLERPGNPKVKAKKEKKCRDLAKLLILRENGVDCEGQSATEAQKPKKKGALGRKKSGTPRVRGSSRQVPPISAPSPITTTIAVDVSVGYPQASVCDSISRMQDTTLQSSLSSEHNLYTTDRFNAHVGDRSIHISVDGTSWLDSDSTRYFSFCSEPSDDPYQNGTWSMTDSNPLDPFAFLCQEFDPHASDYAVMKDLDMMDFGR